MTPAQKLKALTSGVLALVGAVGTTTVVQAAPPNDTKANAITVTLGTPVNGTTVTSTNDAVLTTCGPDGSSPDVWYRYTPAADVFVQWDLCSSASGYDSMMEAFVAAPGNTLGAQIACDDDACGTVGSVSKITFQATAGTSYFIRIAGWNNATGTFTLSGSAATPPPPASSGPDVTVGDCDTMDNYGTQTINGVLIRGMAVGTNSWNIGDRPVAWYSGTTRHPVIGQNMFRLKNGKFEHIGLSWLKHGFASTNSNDFGTCQQPPDGGAQLGVNCADLYWAGLNGSRSYLGPRWDVNPMTGAFTASWSTLVGPTPNDVASRRLQVRESDWAAASNAGAQYWIDTQYVTADDANWNNHRNNISSRKLTGPGNTTYSGATQRFKTALETWASTDASVQLVNTDFHELTQTAIDPLGGPSQTKDGIGRFQVFSKVIDNGNGTWTYQYGIYNINSHRAAAALKMRLPANAVVTGESFSAPFYHSGDRIDNSAWLSSKNASSIKFNYNPTFTPTMTISGIGTVNVQPNYVYWGTMYNYSFTANVAPMTGVARIDLGRGPANSTGYQGTTLAVSGIKVPTICAADIGMQGGIAGADGQTDNNDFVAFIDAFFANDMLLADIGSQGGVAGADNALDNNDFVVFIDAFFAGCI